MTDFVIFEKSGTAGAKSTDARFADLERRLARLHTSTASLGRLADKVLADSVTLGLVRSIGEPLARRPVTPWDGSGARHTLRTHAARPAVRNVITQPS